MRGPHQFRFAWVVVFFSLGMALGACSWADGSGTTGDDEPPVDATPVRCGDGVCASSEIGNCAADCGSQQTPVCGNGTCEAGENSQTCLSDCPVQSSCGNGVCDATETPASCPGDCQSGAQCPTDLFVCLPCLLVGLCPTGHDENSCTQCILGGGGGGCSGGLPDGICDASENSMTCPFDCV